MNPEENAKSLTPQRWQRIEALFHAALQLPEADRADFLRDTCAGGESVADEVLDLLRVYPQQERLIGKRPNKEDADADEARGRIGETVGGYRLDSELGHGGMGTVYLAIRVDGEFEQRVALKVVRPQLRTPVFVERFRVERQILANLNHPNITRLLDGGVTGEGDPYLAMEYVEGQPINRYCDERLLPVPDRIRLFLEACSAVEYAHANLVVHRDLKPGNLLVTREGAPKLLDFGTASLLLAEQEGLKDAPLGTLTPRYASPEQLRGEPVSIAMDLYSMGVMLYELLTGAWPFGDPESPIAGFDRALRGADPTAPQRAITEQSARLRSTKKAKLARMLAGDLGSILMKALAKDAHQRYLSVGHFSDDLRRYLNGEAVLARTGNVVYRAGKVVRRHKLAVASTLLAFLVLVVATIYSAGQAKAARQQTAKAALVVEFLEGLLGAADPLNEGGRADITVREVIDIARVRLNELNPEPVVKGYLNNQLGVSFENFAEFEKAEEQFRSALAISRRVGSSDQVAWAETHLANALAETLKNQDEAEALFVDAVARARRQGKDADPQLLYVTVGQYAFFIWQRYGHTARGEALGREANEMARTDASIPRAWLARSDEAAAEYLIEENRQQEAEKLLDEALAIERAFTYPTSNLTNVLSTLGTLRMKQGDYAAAEKYARAARDEANRVYGKASFPGAEESALLAFTLSRLGHAEEALQVSAEALDTARATADHVSARMALPLTARACALNYAPNGEQLAREAERLAREALADLPASHPNDPVQARANAELGVALVSQRRFAEALPVLQASERTFLALPGWGPKDPETVRVHEALATASARIHG